MRKRFGGISRRSGVSSQQRNGTGPSHSFERWRRAISAVERDDGVRSMRWPRMSGFLGIAGVALFIGSAFGPLPNILTRWLSIPPRLEPAEAIVVLGGGLQPGGLPSSGSLRRALHGILLYRAGLASRLVLLGEGRRGGPTEAQVRAELAGELGIAPDAILTEAGARTTREEAVRVEALLRPAGIRRILLVTDSLHMARARGVFERAGFEVFAAPADELSNRETDPEKRLQLMRRVLEELFGRLYYRLAGYSR